LEFDAIKREPLSGLRQDTFRLDTELIEVKKKPSLPWGERTRMLSKKTVEFKDEGIMIRGIASLEARYYSIRNKRRWKYKNNWSIKRSYGSEFK